MEVSSNSEGLSCKFSPKSRSVKRPSARSTLPVVQFSQSTLPEGCHGDSLKNSHIPVLQGRGHLSYGGHVDLKLSQYTSS